MTRDQLLALVTAVLLSRTNGDVAAASALAQHIIDSSLQIVAG